MIENIAFVYKTGGDFDLEYVQRLVKSVREYCTREVNVYCLSDDSEVAEFCNHIPLKHDDWRRWWAKLELFENFQNCLYFDLDTVIRGDITTLLEHNHKFTMLDDFFHPRFAASGVMAWNGEYSFLAKEYNIHLEYRYSRVGRWGDQGWITEQLMLRNMPVERFQNLYPGLFGSYKAGYEDCDVVCFHGTPRPKEVGWEV